METPRQTIHKYTLGRANNKLVYVDMLADAQVLSIDFDPRTAEFCVWAIVQENARGITMDGELWDRRMFYVAGTGLTIGDEQAGDGLTVDHVLSHHNTFCVNEAEGIHGWFHGFEVSNASDIPPEVM